MADETIYDRLRDIRSERFEQIGDAAEALGIAYPTYAAHENGSRGMTIEAVVRYADFYRVNIEWLLTGRGLKRGRAGLSEAEIKALSIFDALTAIDQTSIMRTMEGLAATYSPSEREPAASGVRPSLTKAE